MKNMSYLCEVSDEDCRDQLRMDRAAFHKLCFILQSVCGLKCSRRVSVSEKVAIFLYILAHHTKNRCVKFAFKWSGQTVSKHFHVVLNSVLRLYAMFLVKPKPIIDSESDPRWQKFQGCLGALDGTYIDVHVPISEKVRYRNRKGQISVNVLGSAADSRVLRNAINMENGLKIPRARNVIERTFGLLKMRWGILRSPSWYPITTANKIIMECCLVHNYIRNEMLFDPLEGGLDEYMSNQSAADSNDYTDVVDSLDTTIEWTTKRDEMALNMFIEWSHAAPV
ncbi:hypothetical protein ACS0TY_022179 [Phlomoides rotata]